MIKQKLIKIKKPGTKHGYKIKCPTCSYEWFPKLRTPYLCPRCGFNTTVRGMN